MRYGGMVEAFASSVYHAIHSGALDYEAERWQSHKDKEAGMPMLRYMRRPTADELEVCAFNQGWGSTALGFNVHQGLAGQSMTSALTVVVHNHQVACVYFGGGFAYRVAGDGIRALLDDSRNQDVQPQREAMKKYGASLRPTPPQEASE